MLDKKQWVLIAAVVFMGLINFFLWRNSNKVPEYDMNKQISADSKEFENWKNAWEKSRYL